jgi:BASS family bile acid:Na+ symporter
LLLQQLLPLGLALIMFSIGLGLAVQDFTRVLRYPKAMGLGLVSQLLLLPLLGLVLALSYTGRPEFALGLMIIAVAPGGITSNLLTMLAGGNMALSVSMTALTSVASIITVPLVLELSQHLLLGASQEVSMPVGRIMAGIFVITGLPIALGMLIQHWRPQTAAWLRPPMRRLSTLIFVLIVLSAFVGQRDNITENLLDIGPRLLLLNIGTMVLGFLIATRSRLNRPDAIAISLECGLQNAALAIFIAVSVLNEPLLMVPAITYALIMNISAALFIFFLRRCSLATVSEQGA